MDLEMTKIMKWTSSQLCSLHSEEGPVEGQIAGIAEGTAEKVAAMRDRAGDDDTPMPNGSKMVP